MSEWKIKVTAHYLIKNGIKMFAVFALCCNNYMLHMVWYGMGQWCTRKESRWKFKHTGGYDLYASWRQTHVRVAHFGFE